MSQRIQITVTDFTHGRLTAMADAKGVELVKEAAFVLETVCGSVDYDERIAIAQKQSGESILQSGERNSLNRHKSHPRTGRAEVLLKARIA